ncbi:MAG: 1,4-dihydroxy-2-naphthoate polyprenyltransferase, partial [Actinomycetota bacterium]
SFIWLPVISLVAGSVWPLAALGALPWARVPLRLMLTRRDARGLIRALAGTARLQLVFGLLLASGLWIS